MLDLQELTLVLRSIFREHIFREGVGWWLLQLPRIINIEALITLHLLPVYSYGCLLSMAKGNNDHFHVFELCPKTNFA